MFVDTGAFYALADRRDPAHDRAKRYYGAGRGSLLTTDYVFAESMSLLTKRLGKSVAVEFGTALRASQRLRIDAVTPKLLEAGWTLFASHADKDWDLIDCTSFAVMQAQRISTAFAFDRHFVQFGLRLVPGDDE